LYERHKRYVYWTWKLMLYSCIISTKSWSLFFQVSFPCTIRI
jgi:hypothetical protein